MFAAQRIPYNQTNSFSRIILDYLDRKPQLRPFYSFDPDLEGFKKIIQEKKAQPIDRALLVNVLNEQYSGMLMFNEVKQNINALLDSTTFTVCTAHQPNLFTGPLYFIYKILHTIKLAAYLKEQIPGYHFVPVYYMGSEDADFAELNHTYVEGKKIEWKKEQRGAVGRMRVDKTLVQLIDELEGQISSGVDGNEVVTLLRKCYAPGKNIQTATFELVNELYGNYGLIVLIPDHPGFKAQMKQVFTDDLFNNTSSAIVQETSDRLGEYYDVQAHPREINLFYLKDDIRERIIKKEDYFIVQNSSIRFTENEIKDELEHHPERFSPNVILRGLYQETILPNLAFIGGGGETAYWLQLKDLFARYQIVFPILVLRNSFLIVEKKWKEKIERLGLQITDFFQSESDLMKLIVTQHSQLKVLLNGNFEKAEELFEQIRSQAGAIDPTLSQHVAAIKTRSLKTLQELEKKMLRAEKRKFAEEQRQIQKIREALFPGNGLQERVENFSAFYSKWGRGFIEDLYQFSLPLDLQFTILTELD